MRNIYVLSNYWFVYALTIIMIYFDLFLPVELHVIFYFYLVCKKTRIARDLWSQLLIILIFRATKFILVERTKKTLC